MLRLYGEMRVIRPGLVAAVRVATPKLRRCDLSRLRYNQFELAVACFGDADGRDDGGHKTVDVLVVDARPATKLHAFLDPTRHAVDALLRDDGRLMVRCVCVRPQPRRPTRGHALLVCPSRLAKAPSRVYACHSPRVDVPTGGDWVGRALAFVRAGKVESLSLVGVRAPADSRQHLERRLAAAGVSVVKWCSWV